MKIFSTVGQMEQAFATDEPRLLLVRGKRLCLVKRGEHLLAIEDRCPHNGESLSKGKVNYLGEIVCPWHGHRFNLKTGREGAGRDRDLITYPVKMDPDGIFVAL